MTIGTITDRKSNMNRPSKILAQEHTRSPSGAAAGWESLLSVFMSDSFYNNSNLHGSPTPSLSPHMAGQHATEVDGAWANTP